MHYLNKDDIIRNIYDKLLELYQNTHKEGYEFDGKEFEDAKKDIKEIINLKLRNGKISNLIIEQIARHKCNYGEQYNNYDEFFDASQIIDSIERAENNQIQEKPFNNSNSLIKGLFHIHHNGRSQFYSNLRNIKEYWFDKKGNPKRDISSIIEKHKNNYRAIFIEMQQKAILDKNMNGEWIIYAKHKGKNYYLCLATHYESDYYQDFKIYNKIKPCFEEFPELANYKKY